MDDLVSGVVDGGALGWPGLRWAGLARLHHKAGAVSSPYELGGTPASVQPSLPKVDAAEPEENVAREEGGRVEGYLWV